MSEVKLIHHADKVSPGGQVSARCFDPPHAINLRRATWTFREEAVTCIKCRRVIEAARGELPRSRGAQRAERRKP